MLGKDTYQVIHPEMDLVDIGSLSVGTIDGEWVTSVSFVCPFCEDGHQIAAPLPKELIGNAKNKEQLTRLSVLFSFEIAVGLIKKAIEAQHDIVFGGDNDT